MNEEINTISTEIRALLGRVCDALEDLNEGQLNWRPPLAESNSVYAIAAHTIGNARAWVLGIACGRPMGRDRPGEFRAGGPDAKALVADAKRLSEEIETALAALPLSEMDRRLVPATVLWGEGEPREISIRQALLQVVEHAALHLGQIQITRDLALENA